MTLKPLVTIDKAWYRRDLKWRAAKSGQPNPVLSKEEQRRRKAWRRFIRSDWWKAFVSKVLEDRRTCECCYSRGSMTVRHVRIPEHWMEASTADVIALCSKCASRFPCDGDELRLDHGAAKGPCPAAPYRGTPGTGIPTTPPEGVGDGGWSALSPDATGDNSLPRSHQGLPA